MQTVRTFLAAVVFLLFTLSSAYAEPVVVERDPGDTRGEIEVTNQLPMEITGTVVVEGPDSMEHPVPVMITNLPEGSEPITGAVAVTNFPLTQPVSGTVSVGNFPVTQPVSGSVNVGNFPANQAVHGEVEVSGEVDIGNFPTEQNVQVLNRVSIDGGNDEAVKVDASSATVPVDVQNWPGAQTVEGTVNIGNFPADQTVTVSNFPATQPVSGTVAVSALPALPAGANAIGSVSVSNLPATQPISAVNLPLPSGAATSAAQTTGNNSIASIDGKLGTLGQKAMSGSAPVVIASDQSTLPVIENDSGKTFRRITANGTTLVKSGATKLYSVCINVLVNNASLTIYDGTSAAGTALGQPTTVQVGSLLSGAVAWTPQCTRYDGVTLATGLFVAANNGPSDYTIIYK